MPTCNTVGARGACCNSLSATYAVDFVHATQISSNQRRGIDFTLRPRGSANDDTRNTCDAGRSGQHIHDRGKSSFATWDIESNATNGRNLLPGNHARGNLCKPLLMRHLALVERADIAYRLFHGRTHRRLQLGVSLLNLSTTHAQLIGSELYVIKARG